MKFYSYEKGGGLNSFSHIEKEGGRKTLTLKCIKDSIKYISPYSCFDYKSVLNSLFCSKRHNTIEHRLQFNLSLAIE